jgi:hypothetical protein
MATNKQMTTRERWYRDSAWQFVGAALTLAAIGVSVWLVFSQQKVKSMQVVVLAETSLLEIPSLVAGDVQVTYQGRPIPNLTLVLVRVENNGTSEIRSADYEMPITLAFPEGGEVLDAEVLATEPKDLRLLAEKQGNKVVLSQVLLNEGDSAIFRFLVAGLPTRWSANSLVVGGRIAGVKKLSVVMEAPTVTAVYMPTGFVTLLLLVMGPIMGGVFFSVGVRFLVGALKSTAQEKKR